MRNRSLAKWQRSAIDFGPLMAFFLVNYSFGIMAGTAVLMVATLIAIVVTYWVERSIPPMPSVTCVLVMIFGGLTLLFDDEFFIKIKPTVVNVLFAGAIVAGLLLGHNLVKIVLKQALSLTDAGWHILARGWVGMFIMLALVNEAVWRSVDTDNWVTFKVFGVPAIVILYSAILMRFVLRHRDGEQP